MSEALLGQSLLMLWFLSQVQVTVLRTLSSLVANSEAAKGSKERDFSNAYNSSSSQQHSRVR
jgi:hypothetical protein